MVWVSHPPPRTVTRRLPATCDSVANVTCLDSGNRCSSPLASPGFHRGRGAGDAPRQAHRRRCLTPCNCANSAPPAMPVRPRAWRSARRTPSAHGAANVTCPKRLHCPDMTVSTARLTRACRWTLVLGSIGMVADRACAGQTTPTPPAATWSVSAVNLTRFESWRFFEPPPGGGEPGDYGKWRCPLHGARGRERPI